MDELSWIVSWHDPPTYIYTAMAQARGMTRPPTRTVTSRYEIIYLLERIITSFFHTCVPTRQQTTTIVVSVQVEFKKLVKQRMALMVANEGRRADGRGPTEVRPISIELGILPIPHGSVLFTRGETQVCGFCVVPVYMYIHISHPQIQQRNREQALVTVTLGNKGMAQRTENLDGSDQKRFYLQYNFPPSSVGEVGKVGAPGRREIGHGNLAERALIPIVPSEEEFPYAIRVESMITESCGSSSMASACGGSLALMDCGVPLPRHIAGVAMGLLLDEELAEPIILTDILGLEDAFGTMDFKVRGLGCMFGGCV